MDTRLSPNDSTKNLSPDCFGLCHFSFLCAGKCAYELYTGKCVIAYYRLKQEFLFIDTEEKYLELPFMEPMYGGLCDTVEYIDFTQKLLIGYGYVGSNCDENPKLKIEKQGNIYQARFNVENRRGCRDSSFERIWFIIDKPTEAFEFTMKR